MINTPTIKEIGPNSFQVYPDFMEHHMFTMTREEMEFLYYMIGQALENNVFLNSYHWNTLVTVEGGKGKDASFNDMIAKELHGKGEIARYIAEKFVKSGRFTGARAYICIGEYGTMAKGEPIEYVDGEDEEPEPEESQPDPEEDKAQTKMDRWFT